MTTVAQPIAINVALPGSGMARALHEGDPPDAYAPVAFDFGSGSGVIPFNALEAFVYVKAVTQTVTAKLYGRLRLKDTDNEVTGAWIQIGSEISQAAGGSSVTRFQLSDLVAGFNEFKVEWTDAAAGAAATSQVGITLI